MILLLQTPVVQVKPLYVEDFSPLDINFCPSVREVLQNLTFIILKNKQLFTREKHLRQMWMFPIMINENIQTKVRAWRSEKRWKTDELHLQASVSWLRVKGQEKVLKSVSLKSWREAEHQSQQKHVTAVIRHGGGGWWCGHRNWKHFSHFNLVSTEQEGTTPPAKD